MSDENNPLDVPVPAGPLNLDKLDESFPQLDKVIELHRKKGELLLELRASMVDQCRQHPEHPKARMWYLTSLDTELQKLKTAGVRVLRGKVVPPRTRDENRNEIRASHILKEMKKLGAVVMIDGVAAPFGSIDWGKAHGS